MPNLNTAVIYGSVRSARRGINAAKFIVRKLQERGHTATLVDAADGFVIVAGEYNHSVPPALKNLLDHFQ